MNSNFLLVPLLCIPMCYQLWLLWDEFLNGFTPQIFHRLEPFTDLPGITVCVPLKYSVPQAFIRQRINQSDSTDLKNACTRYKTYLQNPPDGVHGNLTEYTKMTAARQLCYESHFLWSNPSKPLYLTNFTSLDANQFLRGLQTYEFLRLSLLGHFSGDNPAGFSSSMIVQPNMVSFHWRSGLCMTYFSRATRDWVETLQEVLKARQTSGGEIGEEIKVKTDWQVTRDGDLQTGVIVSRDQPKIWPYRLDSVRYIKITIDYLRLLQYWYGTQARNVTHLQETFMRRYNDEADLPIKVMAHSPYELLIDRTEGRRSNTGSSYWVKSISGYYMEATAVLLSHNVSSFTNWHVGYSKTTLQHVTVPGRYSMYCPETGITSGYSDDDCRRLSTVIHDIASYTRKHSNGSLCIPMETSALTRSLCDQLDPLDMPFCRASISGSTHLHGNVTRFQDRTHQLVKNVISKQPTNCPADETRIVFKFRNKVDGSKIRRQDSDGPGGRAVKYSFQIEQDKVPELTIRFVAKMSTIELLANGCGLCGIWISFSFLGLTTTACQLIHKLKICMRTINLKQINNSVTVSINQLSASSDEKYLFKKSVKWIKLKNCQHGVTSLKHHSRAERVAR